jgi:cell division protein FtsI (penicillin-binding protein 3)
MKSEDKNIFLKAYAIYIGFIILMVIVLYKTVSIQLEGAGKILSFDEDKLPVRMVSKVPRSGEILDMNMIPLVTSVSFFDIRMDPTIIEDKVFDKEITDLCVGLSKLYPDKTAREYEDEIRSARQKGNRYLLIRKRVTNEERKKIAALPIFRLGKLKGGLIDSIETIERKRPNGDMMSRTLGYYNDQGKTVVKVGIEGAFYDYLKGTSGQEIEQRISTGWKKTGKVVQEAVEGADIVSSFDKGIQEVAHSELERQLKDQNATSGCIVVMDVKTGFVRAMSNLTQDKEGNYSEKLNYAIGVTEVPGSTFKLASLMAALEDEKVKLTDSVRAVGKYKFIGKTFEDANDGRGYGTISIKSAFEQSSNVFSQVIYNAYRNEPEAFLSRLDKFGITKPLGIDLPGEASPKFNRPGDNKGWSRLSLPSMGIGYEVLMTPLQILNLYNSVANGGKMMKPQFVHEIRRKGEVIKKFDPIVMNNQICSPETVKLLKSCMEGVMVNGTGKNIKSILFKSAGKTGTARLLNSNKDYDSEEKEYQASFVGYFPADNPIYSCIVVITNPKKEFYGAKVAGTVFGAISQKVYSNTLKYHPAINENRTRSADLPSVKNGNKNDLLTALKFFKVTPNFMDGSDWLVGILEENKLKLKNMPMNKDLIPNLIGLNAKDAVYLIESQGMVAKLKGFGKVVSQSLSPNSPVFKGGVIEIVLQ